MDIEIGGSRHIQGVIAISFKYKGKAYTRDVKYTSYQGHTMFFFRNEKTFGQLLITKNKEGVTSVFKDDFNNKELSGILFETIKNFDIEEEIKKAPTVRGLI